MTEMTGDIQTNVPVVEKSSGLKAFVKKISSLFDTKEAYGNSQPVPPETVTNPLK